MQDDTGVTKWELLEALQRAGCRLTVQEQEVLWEAMDTDQDGRLSAKELGLEEAPALPAVAKSIGVGWGGEDLIAWGAKIFSPHLGGEVVQMWGTSSLEVVS